MTESEKYLNDLKSYASQYGVEAIALEVLNNPGFLICSGAHCKIGHHYGEGGLLQHTWEVVSLCMRTVDFYIKAHPDLNPKEVYLSALFHDYGKIWDYTYDPVGLSWVPNLHRRTIHHIQRSAFEWQRLSSLHNVDEALKDRVTHNILSHHGSRAAGSSVPPYTREAYILHLSDCMSARVDDCDRIDISTLYKNA